MLARLSALGGRVLFGLPGPAKRLLAGGRRVRLDGQELDVDAQLMLAALRLTGHRGLDTMTPEAARAEIRRSARLVAAMAVPVARVEALSIPGPAGSLRAHLYVPRDGARGPLVVYYHGGGWVVGDLDTHDGTCRFLATHAHAGVLAVDYRLAPEHRFPAAVEDALATFRWAEAAAGRLGFDAKRVAVAGDSAGGNLSAVVAQLATAAGGPVPAAQLLIYPVTDLAAKHASYRLFPDGFFLTEAEMDWYRDHYLGGDAETARDPRVSPLRAADLRGLPPAVVLTAGFDVLRDEGEAYARRLEEAGVRVWLRRSPGLIHGFANATALSRAAAAALRAGAEELARVLNARPPG
jgi:acetyl esterase